MLSIGIGRFENLMGRRRAGYLYSKPRSKTHDYGYDYEIVILSRD